MQVLALSTKRTEKAVRAALGVNPVTAPPFKLETGDLSQFEGVDVWYIRLHGLEAVKHVWYGEKEPGSWEPAISTDQVEKMDLTNTVVIAGTCYALESDFPASFLVAGARGFIGGSGFNWASTFDRVVGPDRIATWTVRGLEIGLSLPMAFLSAKAVTLFSAWRMADRDALSFQLLTRTERSNTK